MSGSSGCGSFGFWRSALPSGLFGAYDAAVVEDARRLRFLRRRSDPEFLEIVDIPVPDLAPVVPPPVPLRRSRRVLGLGAEYEEIEPPRHRRRLV